MPTSHAIPQRDRRDQRNKQIPLSVIRLSLTWSWTDYLMPSVSSPQLDMACRYSFDVKLKAISLLKAPKSRPGQILTVLYAIMGIPLYFAFAADLQDWIDHAIFVWLYNLIFRKRRVKPKIERWKKCFGMMVLAIIWLFLQGLITMVSSNNSLIINTLFSAYRKNQRPRMRGTMGLLDIPLFCLPIFGSHRFRGFDDFAESLPHCTFAHAHHWPSDPDGIVHSHDCESSFLTF